MHRVVKRTFTDGAGYLLLLSAVLTGWLPGPGGIPLALAGLSLLSIHNAWARRLRQAAVHNTGKAAQLFFPKIWWVEWLYDSVVVALLIFCAFLELRHAEAIEVGLGISAFFAALFIALTNRDRLQRMQTKHKH